MPTDVISGYSKRSEDGKELFEVTFKTPDIFPVVSECAPPCQPLFTFR